MNFVLKKITAKIICLSFILAIISISHYSINSNYLPNKIFEAKHSLKKTDNSKNNNLEEELENEIFANLKPSLLLSFDLVLQKHGSELILPLGFLSSPPFSPPNA